MRDVKTLAPSSVRLAVGTALVVVGFGLLLAGFVDMKPYAWLLLVIPGVPILALGVLTDDRSGLILAVAGSIMISEGLLLLWSAGEGGVRVWVYGWPLSVPASAGLGIIARGWARSDPDVISIGARLFLAGLVLFLLLALIFQGMVFGQLGGTASIVVPLLFLAVGITLILGVTRARQ